MTQLTKLDKIFQYLRVNEMNRKLFSKVLYKDAINVERMLKIYNSDLITLRKLRMMSDIYRDSNALLEVLDGLDDSAYKEIRSDIYESLKSLSNFYRESDEKGLIERAVCLVDMENNGYFDDYCYANEFVNAYSNYYDSIYVSDFLKENGLTKNQFDRFVDIVSALNPELYDKYLVKSKEDSNARKTETINNVNEIYNGIITGKLPNGEDFTDIELYARVPYYTEETCKELLSDFNARSYKMIAKKIGSIVEKINPDIVRTITDYIGRNNLFGTDQPMITEKEIYGTEFVLNNKKLTDEDKDNIISYMKERRIPFLYKAFNTVKKEYLNNNIKVDKPKQLIRK